MVSSRVGHWSDIVAKHVLLNLNYNAADNEPNSDMNPISPETQDVGHINEIDVGLNIDPESNKETSSGHNVVINEDSLSEHLIASDALVTEATSAVIEAPEGNGAEPGSVHLSHTDSVKSEKHSNLKNVSFDESLIETVFIMKHEDFSVAFDESLHKPEELPVNAAPEQSGEDSSGEIIGGDETEPESADIESSKVSVIDTEQKTDKEGETKQMEDILTIIDEIGQENEALEGFSSSDESIVSKKYDSNTSINIALQKKTVSHVLRHIDTVVYRDGIPMMWKKIEYSEKEILVPVPPNSVSSDTDPQVQKIVKSKDKIEYETVEQVVKDILGHGAYMRIVRKKEDKSKKAKIPGIDWARQLQMERFSSQPHFLYKEQWKRKKSLKQMLGPGSYNIKDFIQLANEKPRSGRGTCDNLGPRFDKSMQSSTPGPGTYGIGGVPQRALEDKASRSFSTKGMLDAGDRKRNLPIVGGYLAPGTYNYKSFTEELLSKNKGPVEDFPGESRREMSAGYFSTPKPSPMGPGHYNVKTFIDELLNPSCQSHGHFSKSAQYPDVPTERHVLFSLQHNIHSKDLPSPAAYTIKELSKYKTVNTPGFLSSAKRDDKMAQKFFAGSSNPIGPGRYNTDKYEKARYVNGHSSVFKSQTAAHTPTNIKAGKVSQVTKKNINHSTTGT